MCLNSYICETGSHAGNTMNNVPEISDDEALVETQPCEASQQDCLLNMQAEFDFKQVKGSWGVLLPASKFFPKLDLLEKTYSFGRDKSCTLEIATEMFANSDHWHSISKKHFSITRDFTTNCTLLEDLSSNGTFVNDLRVKITNSRRQQVLENNTSISMAHKMLRVYYYVDLLAARKTYGYPDAVIVSYYPCQQLGRGASGEVMLAFQANTFKMVALKVINKKTSDSAGMNAPSTVQNEIQIMRSLNHPCVIKVLDVIDYPTQTFIAMDYLAGGTLTKKLVGRTALTEDAIRLIFYQLLHAVQYLHNQGIVHRDLKPDNILLESHLPDTLVKVADFGLSKFVIEDVPRTFCGSMGYLAPEVLEGRGRAAYTPKCDIWSLGIILHECLIGSRPADWEKSDIQKHPEFLKCDKWNKISSEALALIKSMLIKDPKKRATIQQLLSSRWFNDSVKEKFQALLASGHCKYINQKIAYDEDKTIPLNDFGQGTVDNNEHSLSKKPRLGVVITPSSSAEGDEDNYDLTRASNSGSFSVEQFKKLSCDGKAFE